MPPDETVNLFTEFGHPLWMLFIFMLGACVGSYLNVCIYRIPKGLSTAKPDSHCFACNTPIKAWDNIPVLSYFLLRGACRNCGATFSWRYAAVEAFTAVTFLAIWWRHHDQPFVAAIYLAFTGAIIFGSFVDFDHRILPDRVTIGSLLLAPVLSFFVPELHTSTSLPGVLAHPIAPRITLAFIGIAAGYWLWNLLYGGWLLATFKREDITEPEDGSKTGMSASDQAGEKNDAEEDDELWDGYSDGRMLAAVGGLLGWQASVWSFGVMLLMIGLAFIPGFLKKWGDGYDNIYGVGISVGAAAWMIGSLATRAGEPGFGGLLAAYAVLVALVVLGILQKNSQDWIPGSIPVWALLLSPVVLIACPTMLHTYRDGVAHPIPNVLMPVAKSLLGFGVGYWIISLVGHLGKMWKKQEAMGYGDVKLLAAIGALLGWKAALFTLFAAAAIGAVIGITLIVSKRRELGGGIPFGPYISLGAITWMLGGEAIWNAYFAFFAPAPL